ncbi:hypothetical protein HQQ82_01080 [Rathayibacter sp. VKM Ac-2856]|uniref:hypothetical protein n=1 Tax=unclassified Rathayibacter TaxID=2609250 RepID=UPI0015659ED8|nr:MULTISPECIES: hypothetical protein [unclassified Rathayibacter]NQX03388.1 hypothetical protein [Rathayibacter sp. VKM Ac-2858]NQX18556.1 hypothetical protein [Rathayibacter sp. VKM Ac-2856]
MRRSTVLSAVLCGLLLATGSVATAPPASAAPSTAPVSSSPPARDGGVETEAAPLADPVASVDTSAAASTSAPSASLRTLSAAAADFTDVDIPSRADIVVHQVTIALVAPQGTTPSFAAEEARRSLELVDRFYDRETGGAVRFELERLIDWQVVDEPIGCSNTGGLHDWIARKTGWQPGPARHLVAMVPPGDPCPIWANGEQPGDPDDGGRTFQGGPDAILLAHELGHTLSLRHAASVSCDTTWDVPAGASCAREEYGNKTDLMGDSWYFTPLSAPTLAQLGLLTGTRQPVCGAPRTAVLDTLGAGPGAPRALTWTDPQDAGIRYWAQYNDAADPSVDGGSYVSPWQTPREVSGVQILRSTGGSPELLQRPGDGSNGNEFALAGETVPLNTGMSLRVDAIDRTARTATVTVTVPCTQYVGDISRSASVSASYSSDWSSAGAAAHGDTGSAWSSWPRVGEQWLELSWPATVTVDSAAVRFASDAADGAQQGLIPARSWRVDYLDGDTGAWTPVPGASAAGRERDVLNPVSFAPVATTALRTVFQAWGGWDYGGSTGVAEVTVNGVPPTASLAVRGTATTVATSSTRDLASGVTARDARGGALAGRPIAFAITGPATFVDGTRAATVVTGATGAAALPSIRTGTTTGSVSFSARVSGLPAVALPRATVAKPPSVTATALSQKASGMVSVTVTVKNTGTTSTQVTIVTPYGTSTVSSLAAGATTSRTFPTGKSTIAAGSATVTAQTSGLRTTTTAAYRAV